MNKFVMGTVVDDPAKTARIHEELRFQSVQFAPVISNGAGDLAEWTHFGSVLLGLGFKTGVSVSIEGSAVMIGPGLALAAKHVIQPRLERILASEDAPFLGAVTEDGLQLWRLHQVVMNDTDIVILRIELASKFPPERLFHTAALTTRIPKIGERVQIAGFRSEKASEAEISGQVRVGVGEVTAIYLTGRDKVMLPHPCIEVKCNAPKPSP